MQSLENDAMEPDTAADNNEPVKTHHEDVPIECEVRALKNGKPYLDFGGLFFPSWPNVYFGMRLKPGTTTAQAKALAAHINEFDATMFFRWFDHESDGLQLFPRDEHGWAIIDEAT